MCVIHTLIRYVLIMYNVQNPNEILCWHNSINSRCELPQVKSAEASLIVCKPYDWCAYTFYLAIAEIYIEKLKPTSTNNRTVAKIDVNCS